MGKNLYIAEKPSVAREFANALHCNSSKRDGYLESDREIVTWCFGHLVTMSYPEVYDASLRFWRFDTLPFLPGEFKYEVIDSAKKQFQIVSSLLNRPDVDVIYVCTDAGREGEYIYRLVEQLSGVKGKVRKRVWIDSQTEEEILRGIREAKDLSAYDALSDAAYLRAKEDYLMGINFSRALTLKYGNAVKDFLKRDKGVISVGRVMTCVLGMVVNREREIRNFVKTPFYRVLGKFGTLDLSCLAEWKAIEGSAYFNSPLLYKENGFKNIQDAKALIAALEGSGQPAELFAVEKKKETKNPPLLYNLAELQNDCSKLFKISPDETLRIVQELYEKKLVTYPRTDARVLSSAVAKEIGKNIAGLKNFSPLAAFAADILTNGTYKTIGKSRYTNDKQITDHYAIIPTGQGLGNLRGLSQRSLEVYELIARRFLSIFYPAAVYEKVTLTISVGKERFFAGFKVLVQEGYFCVAGVPKRDTAGADATLSKDEFAKVRALKKGDVLTCAGYEIKEGETSPPKKYTSGSIILAMENAGQLIEDEELRAQIKGSGIGTSATRAEILKKLINNEYLSLNKKTQVLSPTQLGEMIYDVVDGAIKPLLAPKLTASWEKGLTMVATGEITPEEYMGKLTDFVGRRTLAVKQMNNLGPLSAKFRETAQFYAAGKKK